MSVRRRDLFHGESKSEDGRYIWLAPVGFSSSKAQVSAYVLDLNSAEKLLVEKTAGVSESVRRFRFSNDSFLLNDGTLCTSCLYSDSVQAWAVVQPENSTPKYITFVTGSNKGNLLDNSLLQAKLIVCDETKESALVGVTDGGNYERSFEFVESAGLFPWKSKDYVDCAVPVYSGSLYTQGSLSELMSSTYGRYRVIHHKTLVRSVNGKVVVTTPVSNPYVSATTDSELSNSFRNYVLHYTASTRHGTTTQTYVCTNFTASMVPVASGSVDSTISSGILQGVCLSEDGKEGYALFTESGGTAHPKRFVSSLWKSEDYCNAFVKISTGFFESLGQRGEIVSGIATNNDGTVVYVTTTTVKAEKEPTDYASGSVYLSKDGGNEFTELFTFNCSGIQTTSNMSGASTCYFIYMTTAEGQVQVACNGKGNRCCVFAHTFDSSKKANVPVMYYTENFGKVWKSVSVQDVVKLQTGYTASSISNYKPGDMQYRLMMNRSILENIE